MNKPKRTMKFRLFYTVLLSVSACAIIGWSVLSFRSQGHLRKMEHRNRIQIAQKNPSAINTGSGYLHQSIRKMEQKASKHSNDKKRIIIMCLFDAIVPLGLSLIRELRCLGNVLPIQINHCDELSEESMSRLKAEYRVSIVDVCTEMKNAGLILDIEWFKSYWIKPLSIMHSEYEEIMLLDADDIFMKDPNVLWETKGYKETGTLFFYDRVINNKILFNGNSGKEEGKSWLNTFVYEFDHDKFRRYKGGVGNRMQQVPYEPSPLLLKSYAWSRKTCHHQDSSIVLWNKAKQERATQILFHLITETIQSHGFSHGDKESFWLACELAQTDYFFSPWGVGVVSGYQDMNSHPDTLCGSIAQYMPDESTNSELLYINGRALVKAHPVEPHEIKDSPLQNLYNSFPARVTVRQHRRELKPHPSGQECLKNVPSIKLERNFYELLSRRRAHYSAYVLKTNYGLNLCHGARYI